MSRLLLLDLFCGVGGASEGYRRAGFDVVGVDIEPQPNYPYPFFQGDALDVLRQLVGGATLAFCDRRGVIRLVTLADIAVIHASPPCQAYSVATKAWNGRDDHPDLVPPTRVWLKAAERPYVIENVPGAPLNHSVMLCGSSFGLAVERHRMFESNVVLSGPPCDHDAQRRTWPEGFPALRSGRTKRARVVSVFGTGGGPAKDIDLWRWAMQMDWPQTRHELAEAIPPAYTEHLGRQLIAAVREREGSHA